MIKQLTDYLDYGIFAEISVVIFAAVFVAVAVRTMLMKSKEAELRARIVLNDDKGESRYEP